MGSDLLTRIFRANPAYELVPCDRLSPGERGAVEAMRRDASFYGLLRPRRPEDPLWVKAVDRDTALLFLTLREPGTLPSYLPLALGEDTGRTVCRLLADRVLEVERDGGFVSGAGAWEELGEAESRAAAPGRLAELSQAALRHGQALGLQSARQLSARLYAFNRRPLTPRWQRLLPTAEAVADHLGIGPGGKHRQLLGRHWAQHFQAGAWLIWRSRGVEEGSLAGSPVYKLYLSPAPESLAAGFGDLLGALAAARVPRFKLGRDAAGLLRPDKLVAYFPGFERLAEAASLLGTRLLGMRVQGVPFTSEITADGLLSWGVDPPAGEWTVHGAVRESWRCWLTHRLAVALLDARAAAPQAINPWQYALARLRLEGVDTHSWTPAAHLWREA